MLRSQVLAAYSTSPTIHTLTLHLLSASTFWKVQFRSGFAENNSRFDWHSRLFETFRKVNSYC